MQHFEYLGLAVQENEKCDKNVKRESRQDEKKYISGVICDTRLATNVDKEFTRARLATVYNVKLDRDKRKQNWKRQS